MSKKEYKASPPHPTFALTSVIGWGIAIFMSIKFGISDFLDFLFSEILVLVMMFFAMIYPLFWYFTRFNEAKKEEERQIASQKREKAAQKRKARLIKEYGEVDGMRIFNKEITEKKYKKEELKLKKAKEFKAKMYKQYGKDAVTLILEKNNNSRKKYSWEPESITDLSEKFIKKECGIYLKLADKYGKKIGLTLYNEELFIDMTKEMLVDSYGKPGDQKKTVTKSKITEKYYFRPRRTQQYTTVYQLEVTLENDIVVGWKDLD